MGFAESLRVRRVNGELKSALKVTGNLQSGEAATFIEKIDAEYPRAKDGKVEWE